MVNGQRISGHKLKSPSTIDIFHDLGDEELVEIARQITVATYKAGQTIFVPQENGHRLFLLQSGRVQLYCLSARGKKLVLTMLEPGAIFGEMVLVGQGLHRTFAEATADCLVYVMHRDDITRLLYQKPEVALRLIEVLGKRLANRERRLQEVVFKRIPARLASVLLALADREGSDQIAGYSHQDLADMLGTYRETISETLQHFRADGLVRTGWKQIWLEDRERLELVAAG